MTEAGTDHDACAELCEYWPSPRAVVSAYAGVVGQLWELGNSWYRMVVEQGYFEDDELTTGSVIAYVPQDRRNAIDLGVSAIRTHQDGIPRVTPVAVRLVPRTVPPGEGRFPVTVSVKEPPGVTEVRVTLWNSSDPTGPHWSVFINLAR